MANKFKEARKKEAAATPPSPQIQYVPYENYISRALASIVQKLDKLEKQMDVIKERITNDYPSKEIKK